MKFTKILWSFFQVAFQSGSADQMTRWFATSPTLFFGPPSRSTTEPASTRQWEVTKVQLTSGFALDRVSEWPFLVVSEKVGITILRGGE